MAAESFRQDKKFYLDSTGLSLYHDNLKTYISTSINESVDPIIDLIPNKIFSKVTSGTSYFEADGKTNNLTFTSGTGVSIELTSSSKTIKVSTTAASSSVQGTVKIGSNISIDNGTISISKDNVINALGFTPIGEEVKYALGVSSGGAAVEVAAAVGSSGASVSRYVYFADDGSAYNNSNPSVAKPNVASTFKYNPGTDLLNVGNITSTGVVTSPSFKGILGDSSTTNTADCGITISTLEYEATGVDSSTDPIYSRGCQVIFKGDVTDIIGVTEGKELIPGENDYIGLCLIGGDPNGWITKNGLGSFKSIADSKSFNYYVFSNPAPDSYFTSMWDGDINPGLDNTIPSTVLETTKGFATLCGNLLGIALYSGTTASTQGTLTLGSKTFNGNADVSVIADDLKALSYSAKNTGITTFNSSNATTSTTYTITNTIVANSGMIIGGSASAAGLATRGICGVSTPSFTGSCTKENLYVNYDGNNTYATNRQLVLGAEAPGSAITTSTGTSTTAAAQYGCTYSAVRGDQMVNYVTAKITASVVAATSSEAGLVKPGTGLSISSDGTLNHSNSITSGTIPEGGSDRVLSFGDIFKIPSISYDANGHITSTDSISLTLPLSAATSSSDGLMSSTDKADLDALVALGLKNAAIKTAENTFLEKNTFSAASTVSSTSTEGSGTINLPNGGIYAKGGVVANAFYSSGNDFADCISSEDNVIDLEPGYCYCYNGEKYYKSTKYLDEGIIGINSDTYGMHVGSAEKEASLRVAVSGFALAYVDKEYKPGTPLTCTEKGYLTEISKQDKIEYPERIIATFWKKENKEYWISGLRRVEVNNRMWVKIR